MFHQLPWQDEHATLSLPPPCLLRVPACVRVQSALEELSSQYASTKFVRAVATEVIPNYPDANVPTLLVYHNRAVKATLVGLKNITGAGSSCTASGE